MSTGRGSVEEDAMRLDSLAKGKHVAAEEEYIGLDNLYEGCTAAVRVMVWCFSIIPQSTLDWNEPVSCSEVDGGANFSNSESGDIDLDKPAILNPVTLELVFASSDKDNPYVLKGYVDIDEFDLDESQLSYLNDGNLSSVDFRDTVPNEDQTKSLNDVDISIIVQAVQELIPSFTHRNPTT